MQVHEEAYVTAFCGGRLDDGAVKRIGFGDVVRAPVLVERTLTEVAGAHCAPQRLRDQSCRRWARRRVTLTTMPEQNASPCHETCAGCSVVANGLYRV